MSGSGHPVFLIFALLLPIFITGYLPTKFCMQSAAFNQFSASLFRRTDNISLALFRIIFGFLLFYHCLYHILSGKVYENFIHPPFTFTYIGFEWLQPLPGDGMYYYFGLMALLGLLIMAGAWYRLSMAAFSLGWIIIYLMQKSDYNNHYYLVLLLCCGMSCMPAHTALSVDAKRKPQITTNSCPQWIYWIFIAQMAILYFYAAINKCNSDWLSGRFIALQFAPLSSRRFTGIFYGNQFFQLFICYAGLIFDLLIVPLLLWKRTRYYALPVYFAFHLFNSYTFRIGIFPYLSMAMALFFIEPERLRRLVLPKRTAIEEKASTSFEAIIPARKIFSWLLLTYLLLQLLLPLRFLLYPGNVFWTEEGYRMSWKMMARIKTGHIRFKVFDSASATIWQVDPAEKFSAGHAKWIAIAPDIAWQYAQHLKKEFSEKGYPAVKIFAIDSVKLNQYPSQLLIDTTVDLAAVKWQPFRHSEWILPLKEQ